MYSQCHLDRQKLEQIYRSNPYTIVFNLRFAFVGNAVLSVPRILCRNCSYMERRGRRSIRNVILFTLADASILYAVRACHTFVVSTELSGFTRLVKPPNFFGHEAHFLQGVYPFATASAKSFSIALFPAQEARR